MAKIFKPSNWYWIVAGDESRVFSSASGDYVPVGNPTYQAWAADGTKPTRILNEVELGAVLAEHLARPVNAAVLDAYLDAHATEIVNTKQFKILFNHENRVRAIERQLGLNGSPPNVTPAQAKAAVKPLM